MTLFGFREASRMINNLAHDIEIIQMEGMRQIGLEAEKTAVEYLQKQDLGCKPLSERYKALKKRKGLSEKTLIATSTYFQSITSWTTKQAIYVGVKRNVKNKDGEEVANIAKVHEYGSVKRNIPARPLWKPTLVEMQGRLAKRTPFVTAMFKYVKRKYGA